MKLTKLLAKMCSYAQEHIDTWNDDSDTCHDDDNYNRELMLECTSFQVACFLAQNTVEGHHGVEWEVVIDDLTDRPMKTEKQWRKIIKRKVAELGGWKDPDEANC